MLIKCPECGENISDTSTQCVHCGCHISIHQDKEIMDILRTSRKVDATKRLIEKYNLSFADATAYMKEILENNPDVKAQNDYVNRNQNIPKCPTCSSTHIERVGMFERWLTDYGRKPDTFVCKNCGYKW